MCGITAYLGKNKGAKYLLNSIQLLRNRGYDSMGCCSIINNQFCLTRYANRTNINSFDLLKETFNLHEDSHCLMGHCRWATTGRVTDENSHPHIDTIKNKLAIVHNGIISNYNILKTYLINKNIHFNSETDTEVIINLIAYYNQDNTMMDAIKLTLQELEGTWALDYNEY